MISKGDIGERAGEGVGRRGERWEGGVRGWNGEGRGWEGEG